MTQIFECLKDLNKQNIYPFHMPGHKRQKYGDSFVSELFSRDITEITGYDDLHQPEGIIRDAMSFIKEVYGVKESYLLINGSTAGNLAAVAALCKIGDKILMARNCHKSIYHAVELLGLHPVYVYPEIDEDGICLGIKMQQIAEILDQEKDIKAAVIVSPTYEGRISEVQEISELLHSYGIPLIVDEAHGAHFVFHSVFPESAVSQGADLVIQSLHKTLPSLTQTGILHLCSDFISGENIQRKLSIFQSSSPSYLLMASAEWCVHRCAENPQSFQQYADQLLIMRRKLKELVHIHLVENDDPGKLVLSVKNTSMTGQELFDLLRDSYHLELEMAEISYVIAMTSVCDTEEGWNRFFHALHEIDQKISNSEQLEQRDFIIKNQMALTPQETSQYSRRPVDLEKAEGTIGADFIFLYPPGIPLIVPGEIISRNAVQKLLQYENDKMKMVGVSDHKIYVLNKRI